jgi:methionyl-tRNA synthetase
MNDCHCDDDDDRENDCGECGNPLGPFNITGYCKACTREIEREREEARHARDDALYALGKSMLASHAPPTANQTAKEAR